MAKDAGSVEWIGCDGVRLSTYMVAGQERVFISVIPPDGEVTIIAVSAIK